MISLVSVAVNCAVIFFTSNALSYIIDSHDYTLLQQFMYLILIEHIIIAFKLFISIVIRDKPAWVSHQENERMLYSEQVRSLIEERKERFIEGGGMLLEDRLVEARKRKEKEVN